MVSDGCDYFVPLLSAASGKSPFIAAQMLHSLARANARQECVAVKWGRMPQLSWVHSPQPNDCWIDYYG